MLTSTLVIISAAIAIAAAFGIRESRKSLLDPTSRKRGDTQQALPDLHGDSTVGYTQHDSLLTPAERAFFGVLEQAIGDRYRVMAKVRIADVLKPGEGLDRSGWRRAFNRISAKHFDFLLCHPGDLSFVCAVELNDRSHGKFLRRRRDGLLEAICRSSGLPLVTIVAKRGYVVRELRETLFGATGATSEAPRLAAVADSA